MSTERGSFDKISLTVPPCLRASLSSYSLQRAQGVRRDEIGDGPAERVAEVA